MVAELMLAPYKSHRQGRWFIISGADFQAEAGEVLVLEQKSRRYRRRYSRSADGV
jgi:hypothetical protein